MKYTVGITGMMCAKCESRMAAALAEKLAAKNVECSHDKNEAVFEADREVTEAEAKAVVEDTGYKFIMFAAL